ncbi:cupredoxin domain-containing protein [Dechloromonas sp. A34]|uniref:cupredoxin domain-containing protein n=1 Tax=Dechloromonas sp. A34 TaxID=447588 RepID=UPI0022490D28|nr:cupredoxin domain-containing protein [Dechloromonas sp. A34]
MQGKSLLWVGMLAAALAPSVSSAEYAVAEPDKIVKSANWEATQTVTVIVDEHGYAPEDLKFVAGQPYKLELKNPSDKDHYFTAPEFFRNVAWRKAMVNRQAEIKAPYFTAVEILKKGGQIDLYFVPVNKGSYPVYCTIDDHREKGMEGTIAIE